MSDIDRQYLHSEFAAGLSELQEQRQRVEGNESEAARWHETCEFIASSCNHEAKVITGLCMAEEPDRFFSANALSRSVTQRQGHNPGWAPEHSVVVRYCEHSLEPIGHVVRGRIHTERIKQRLVTAYKIDNLGIDKGVPAWGLISDWGLRYRDVSVQQAFGATHSATQVRAAETRINLLMELMTAPQNDVAISDIEGMSCVDPQTIVRASLELQLMELIETAANSPSLRISPRHDQALQELMHIVLALHDNDPSILAYGRQRARQIINDADKVAFLMAKARRFSAQVFSEGSTANAAMIKNVVNASAEPLSAKDVGYILNGNGYSLGSYSVSQYLRDLAAQGELGRTRMPKDANNKRPVLKYTKSDKQ